MSLDLKDFRGKITPDTDIALEAHARATGRDKAEIARQVLDEWARTQIHVATVITRLTRSEGGRRED